MWGALGASGRAWEPLGRANEALAEFWDDQGRAGDAWDDPGDFRTRARDSPATAALVPFAVSHHVAPSRLKHLRTFNPISICARQRSWAR